MEKIIWKTEKRKLADLKPFEGNPRKATEKEVKDIDKSLERFNLADPLVINTTNTIIGGHLRYNRLKAKGIKEVDVRVPSRKLTGKEAEELCLRLNKNTGSFDFDLLANFEEDLLKDIGFESDELDKIFQLDDEKDDEIPELPKKAKSKLGDLYQLGNHRLLCGSVVKREDVKRLMGGKKAKLCFTSPPYNMAGDLYKNYRDNLKSEEYINFNIKAINAVRSILRGFLFWNISYNRNTRWEFIEILHRIITESGLRFLELIIWDKGHGMPISSREMLTRSCEPILMAGDQAEIDKDFEFFCIAGTEKKLYFNKKNNRGITNYWRIDTGNTQQSEIQACFPVALPIKGMLLTTERGDNIIDPFGGSGSTLIAAEKINRKAFICEIEPLYIDLIIERYKNYAGRKAKKIK